MTDKPGAAYAALPECLTCSDHGAVGNTLTAEPCPDCTPTPQAADTGAAQGASITAGMEPAATVRTLGVVGVKFSGWTDYGCSLPDGTKLYTEAQLQAQIAAAPQPSPTAQSADSVPAVSDLPPLPAPDLRDVGTKPQEIKEFLKGYATEYARAAIAARAPADSVLEDAAQESMYRRGYRHGYEQRDAEVRGALA